MKPNTKYAKSGEVNIAYQVFGSGAIDLVYIPGWISNIDLMWACPELVNFLNELGKIARVILFDKRGTGLSDRVLGFPTLEERMDDIRAVMDAVNSEKAVLFGHSEGGSVSALFAATYPNRTISLIAFGIFAKRIYSPNYPWAPTNEERQKVYDMIEKSWGSGDMNLESLAPSKANDKVFMDWLANYFRSGASPSAALTLTKMNTQVDIIDILGSIKVPTLILQRTNDIDVKIEEGRFIAERIQGAKLVELEGNDHLFWAGNTQEVLEEMKSFILNVRPKLVYEKQLFTIIVGRLISLEANSASLRKHINACVKRFSGNAVQYNEETFTVTFNGPSKAVLCSIDLVEMIHSLNGKLNIGIHIRECYADHCISKETENLATSILKQSQPNQVLLTQTVKNLLIGVNLNFAIFNTIFDVVSGDSILLFTVSKKHKPNKLLNGVENDKIVQYDSFLEIVVQVINKNLSNEEFGVVSLCQDIGVSERQLQRKLKEITQKSPNQLISSIRLNHAKELLLSTSYTISEIAFKTGFSNPSYFSKCFKKEFSINPSDLKLKQ
ncbi:alpha/beta fold hydrolase [Winogradskyella flava]|uniref:Alpha/beta fold hydrolase n=1 Tax=Winogradskyella flava TaxID=1884876 RepID=A0A842IMC1_9FLAO|nr:alpha/beta fold hydrolase [Winogradskyella flava]MBC2844392.1 alpha/beta fold hydrolase [Winogradskyella flava]